MDAAPLIGCPHFAPITITVVAYVIRLKSGRCIISSCSAIFPDHNLCQDIFASLMGLPNSILRILYAFPNIHPVKSIHYYIYFSLLNFNG